MGRNLVVDIAKVLKDFGVAGDFGGNGDWSVFGDNLQPKPERQFALWDYDVVPVQTAGSYDEFHFKLQITGRGKPNDSQLLRDKMNAIKEVLVGLVNHDVNGSIIREVTVLTVPTRLIHEADEGQTLSLSVANYQVVWEIQND